MSVIKVALEIKELKEQLLDYQNRNRTLQHYLDAEENKVKFANEKVSNLEIQLAILEKEFNKQKEYIGKLERENYAAREYVKELL